MYDDDRSGWYQTGSTGGEQRRTEPNDRPDYTDPFWTPEAEQKKKKHSKMKITMLILGLIVLIIASAYVFAGSGKVHFYIFGPGYTSEDSGTLEIPKRDETEDTVSGKNSIPAAETGTGVTMTISPVPGGSELTLQEIYTKCLPSVVGIRTELSTSQYSMGTGIIMTADGYIVTNTHVLDGGYAVTVTLSDGTEHEAKLVGADTISDLAVLKIEVTGLTPAQFGDSSGLQVGDSVVTIGNPLGEDLRGTMTNGIISAINRDITYDGHLMTLIQTNAAINEGNSGGPLINMYGQVIGITNMKAVSTNGVEGIGFAIPTASVHTVVDALIAEGRVSGRPSIGITIAPVSSSALDYYDLPDGLYIESVAKGSDAEKQGVQSGDILVAVNGESVATTYDVNAIKDGLQVGDSMTLTLYRDGKTFDVTVTLVDTNDIY